MVIAPKKPKNPRLILTIGVVLDQDVEMPFVVTVPKSASVGSVYEAATGKFLAERDPSEWGWALPHLELSFMKEDSVLIDEPPPWAAADLMLPFVREAKPMKLVLRLSSYYIGTKRLVEDEEAGRDAALQEVSRAFTALRIMSDEDHAHSQLQSEMRQAFEQKADALSSEEEAGRVGIVNDEETLREGHREVFWEKLCTFIRLALANSNRLSKLRGKLVEELSAAAELQASLAAEDRVRAFPLSALHGSAKEPPPPPPPPSLFELTFPTRHDLAIVDYTRREVGPPYKPGAPDGLMRCSVPLSELAARRPKAKHAHEPAKGFPTGDRKAFERATNERMRVAASIVCASDVPRR
eukprot:TRINITY_DN5542_c0_g5_i1.p1 TRINITY_DN5542_c0_g5~~TRINITY_DN5542_c0_g5_i1.p1  ORF type:complete len:353 (+),score=86.66 TRINITY_DN5542_c0_g5_i1:127-1185(+)